MLLIGPAGTNFSEIIIEIYTFSFKKMHVKMSSVKWRPICLGRDDLNRKFKSRSCIHVRPVTVPFHKDFSPSGELLEHRKLAHGL